MATKVARGATVFVVFFCFVFFFLTETATASKKVAFITVTHIKVVIILEKYFFIFCCLEFKQNLRSQIKQAMHERTLVSVKVEPRSNSRLSSALFILRLFYLRD